MITAVPISDLGDTPPPSQSCQQKRRATWPPTCSFGGELELGAELVVAVGVLGGDPRQVDRRRPQRRDREVAGVEVPLAVDGVQLPLRPQRVPRRRAAPRPPVVRQGSPLHPELRKIQKNI